MGFGDFAFSMQMRDTITKIVAEAVDNLRPRTRYATVNSISRFTAKATVTYNGESNPVQVNIAGIVPNFVGQTVRIDGIGTDKFISGVVGDACYNTPGDLKISARGTSENGWIFCDGRAVSRVTYADLFSTISTSFGAGDGSTTFNVPDYRDKVPVGAGLTYALWSQGGEKAHALTAAENGTHTHVQDSHNHGQNSHGHAYIPANLLGVNGATWVSPRYDGYGAGPANANEEGTLSNRFPTIGATTATNIAATATNQNSGSSTPHNNMQPYIATNIFIRT